MNKFHSFSLADIFNSIIIDELISNSINLISKYLLFYSYIYEYSYIFQNFNQNIF